jgi:hypothetical protein
VLNPPPIADPGDVDVRRRAVGLGPLAEDVEQVRAEAQSYGDRAPADGADRKAAAEDVGAIGRLARLNLSEPSLIVECMFDLGELAAVDPHADEAALIEQIAWLERVKSAAAAGQARAAAALDEKRRADEAAAGVPKAKQGRGVASEVALARQDSPARGGRHLGLAKALVHEMPYTLAALECGALSEWRATLIARESACLTVEDRRVLDAELCADVAKLEGMRDARITAAAKEIAARLDAQAVVDRAAKRRIAPSPSGRRPTA